MDKLITSELVSEYGYAIVADASGTIFCKEGAVSMFGDLLTECDEDLPPYQEDFSFVVNGDKISLYLGDLFLLTLAKEELQLILTQVDG